MFYPVKKLFIRKNFLFNLLQFTTLKYYILKFQYLNVFLAFANLYSIRISPLKRKKGQKVKVNM